MVSLLGQHHEALAYHMTFRAKLAAVVTTLVFSALAMAASIPFALIILPAYVIAELVFAIIYFYRYLLLSYQPVKHRPLSHDPRDAFARAMQHMQQFADIRHFLSIWFHGAPMEDIKRENVADLLAYAFFYRTREEVAAEGLSEELESMVAFIEHTWGVDLTPGYNSKLRWMCHLWEPMRHWYRPLGFYLFMELAAFIGNLALRAAGFKQSTWMGITYFTRNMPVSRHQQAGGAAGAAEADSSGEVPLVLLHGIGMGLIPYISLLFNMAATGRPVIALQFKHVSMRWVLWVPTVDEVAEVLVGILRREGVEKCCLVGHSYGTAVASRLLQQHPEKIVQLCMIDPVCFSMFMPNLLRNFLYESPRTGSLFGDFMMMSAARDLHVAATLSRRFFWTDVNLWEEQLPAGSLVVLSGRDVLMAAAEVKAWLELRTDAVVMYHPELPHAGFLMNVPWQQQILQQLLPMLDNVCAQIEQEQQQGQGDGPTDPTDSYSITMESSDLPQQNKLEPKQHTSSPEAAWFDKFVGGQQQARGYGASPSASKSRSPSQQQSRPQRSTKCSAVSDGFSRGTTSELSAVAAIAAATGMAGYPHAHALSAAIHGDAVPAIEDLHSISNRSSMDMRPMTESVCFDQKPGMLLSQISSSSRGSSAAAGLRTALLSSSSSNASSSSQGQLASGGLSCSSAGSSAARLWSAEGVVTAVHPGSCWQGDRGWSRESGAVSYLQRQQKHQLEPLRAWNSGALPVNTENTNLSTSSTPCWATSRSMPVQFDARSVASTTEGICSAAEFPDSPRTYFSGASNQSWQDFAQLAHSREAANAARALLQPVLQQQQRRQQPGGWYSTSRGVSLPGRLSSDDVHSGGSYSAAGFGAVGDGGYVGGQGPRPLSASREGMLRRVDVLLHRRGGRQPRHTGGGDGVGRGARVHGSIAL